MNWFEVDKQGLAKLLARKGKAFAVSGLIENACDTHATVVSVRLDPVPGAPYAWVEVEDDDPQGFAKLEHAFTIFAESTRKGEAEKRGRWNLGEKLALALCSEASIETVAGTVVFDDTGRSAKRSRRERGSLFRGRMHMTREELTETLRVLKTIIPAYGVTVTVNRELIKSRAPVATIEASLPTELADAEGVLRTVIRKTQILVYEPLLGETSSLYELGFPVVETGDKWHLDVQQKVPLNFERDNVPPSYLRKLRALVLNEMHANLTTADANATWVRDASSNKDCSELAIESVLDLRFGPKRVAYDPSDPEANKLAVSKGYVVVHGGMLSGAEWDNAKKAEAILPAGKVTPSKPEVGGSATPVLEKDWTLSMKLVAAHAVKLASRLLSIGLDIQIHNDPWAANIASYSKQVLTLYLNFGRLGHEWFNGPWRAIDALLIHEFAHHFASDHLSEKYHDALCGLGAQLAEVARDEPDLWRA